MKLFIITSLLILFPISGIAQTDSLKTVALSENAILILPEYQGGNRALQLEVVKKFMMPDTTKSVGRSFRMIAEFIVTETGDITDIQVRNALQKEAEQEFIRVLQSLNHRFSPGTEEGKPVRVRYTLPLYLKIE